ncbi:MAG TPA: hypothetical protein VN832_05965 [Stellaceae bacterium]|nr:hypothetical protein [Stellaceae bacterium]
MPDQFWNIIGALTIFAALIASHPLRPSAADELEARFEQGLQEMLATSCTPAGGPDQCLPAVWVP